jgi:hypothetical protein
LLENPLGGGGNGPQVERLIQNLTPENQTKLEGWKKKKLVKSCDVQEIFSGRNGEHQGINDLILLKSNNYSSIYYENSTFAMIAGHSSLSGLITFLLNLTFTSPRQNYSLKAETKRKGSNCSLYLFDQKFYETYIAESVYLGAYYDPENEDTTSGPIPEVKDIGWNGKKEVSTTGLTNHLSRILSPSHTSPSLCTRNREGIIN